MIVNIVVVSGEAQLTVGIGAIFLTFGGVATGAVLGFQGGAVGRTIMGAVIGGLFGVLAFFAPGLTRLAPLILIAGAVAGGMMAGNARPSPPSRPPPPPPGPTPS